MQNCVNIEENKDENDRILNELTEFTNTRVHSAELAVLQKKKKQYGGPQRLSVLATLVRYYFYCTSKSGNLGNTIMH